MEIYAININFIDELDYHCMKEYLSTETIEKIEKFKFFNDKLRSVVSEILVRILISKRHNISNNHIKIKKNDYGKPYSDNYDTYFNISHSGHWVVVAIDNEDIGIDIEDSNAKIDYESLISGIFKKEEQNYIKYYSRKCGKHRFYKLWTLKESYVKLIGKGLSIPLDSFLLEYGEDDMHWKTKSDFYNGYVKYKNYYIDNSYIISVCTTKNSFPNIIKEVDMGFVYESLSLLKRAI